MNQVLFCLMMLFQLLLGFQQAQLIPDTSNIFVDDIKSITDYGNFTKLIKNKELLSVIKVGNSIYQVIEDVELFLKNSKEMIKSGEEFLESLKLLEGGNKNWKLGANINPCDGANFGYAGPWSKNSNVGDISKAFTNDFLDNSVWKEPVGYVTIARHVKGVCTMSKTWKLKVSSKSMYNYFSTYPGRIYATGDGTIKDNHIDSDIPKSAEGLTGKWKDSIFGANGGLVFNWWYSNNGVRIGVAGSYKNAYKLPATNVNDDSFDGIGMEFLGDTRNGRGSSAWWHDVGRMSPPHAMVGTDGGSSIKAQSKEKPCWGSYAVFVSTTDQKFRCQGVTLSKSSK